MEFALISFGISILIFSMTWSYQTLSEVKLRKTSLKSSLKSANSKPTDDFELSKRLEEFRQQRFARPIINKKRE